MDEQPLLVDEIAQTIRLDPSLKGVPAARVAEAVMGVVERVEAERDVARRDRDDAQKECTLHGQEMAKAGRLIRERESERDVARRERDEAIEQREFLHAAGRERVADLREQVARLTEERDALGKSLTVERDTAKRIENERDAAEAWVFQLQTALKRLAGLLDPKVPPAPQPYLRQIVDDALAAVPVVPDPPTKVTIDTFERVSYTDKDE